MGSCGVSVDGLDVVSVTGQGIASFKALSLRKGASFMRTEAPDNSDQRDAADGNDDG